MEREQTHHSSRIVHRYSAISSLKQATVNDRAPTCRAGALSTPILQGRSGLLHLTWEHAKLLTEALCEELRAAKSNRIRDF